MTDQQIFGMLVLMGVVVFLSGIYVDRLMKRKTGRKQSDWVETTGSVTSSKCRHVGPSDADDRTTDYYSIYVQFEFEIGGIRYSNRQTWASDSIIEYSLNAPITIYYDPHNPKKAVAKREPKEKETIWIAFILYLLGFLLILLGVVGLVK